MGSLVALTGAGISKASGIPTFEELGDLRDKLSRSYYQQYPEQFYLVLKEMKKKIDQAQPNPAHLALAKHKIDIITMNIDGLHQKAGSTDALEIHGNLRTVRCRSCSKEYDFSDIYKSIYCTDCNCVLEPDIVLYGDRIPHYGRAVKLVQKSTGLIIIGTSFFTSTSGDLARIAKLQGIPVHIVNEKAEENIPKLLEQLSDT